MIKSRMLALITLLTTSPLIAQISPQATSMEGYLSEGNDFDITQNIANLLPSDITSVVEYLDLAGEGLKPATLQAFFNSMFPPTQNPPNANQITAFLSALSPLSPAWLIQIFYPMTPTLATNLVSAEYYANLAGANSTAAQQFGQLLTLPPPIGPNQPSSLYAALIQVLPTINVIDYPAQIYLTDFYNNLTSEMFIGALQSSALFDSIVPNLSLAQILEFLPAVAATKTSGDSDAFQLLLLSAPLFTSSSIQAYLSTIPTLLTSLDISTSTALLYTIAPLLTIPQTLNLLPLISNTNAAILLSYQPTIFTPANITANFSAIQAALSSASTTSATLIQTIAPNLTFTQVLTLLANIGDTNSSTLLQYTTSLFTATNISNNLSLIQSTLSTLDSVTSTALINTMVQYLPTTSLLQVLAELNPADTTILLNRVAATYSLSKIVNLLNQSISPANAKTLITLVAPSQPWTQIEGLATQISNTNFITFITVIAPLLNASDVESSTTLLSPSALATLIDNVTPATIADLTASWEQLSTAPAAEIVSTLSPYINIMSNPAWTLPPGFGSSLVTLIEPLLNNSNPTTALWAQNSLAIVITQLSTLTLPQLFSYLPLLSDSSITTLITTINVKNPTIFDSASITANLALIVNMFTKLDATSIATLVAPILPNFITPTPALISAINTLTAANSTTLFNTIAPQLTLLQTLTLLPQLNDANAPILLSAASSLFTATSVTNNLLSIVSTLKTLDKAQATALGEALAPYLINPIQQFIAVLNQMPASSEATIGLIAGIAPHLSLSDVINQSAHANFSDSNFQTLMQYMTFTSSAVASDLSNIAFTMQTTGMSANEQLYLGQALAPIFTNSTVLAAIPGVIQDQINIAPLLTSVIPYLLPNQMDALISAIPFSTLLPLATANQTLLNVILAQPSLFQTGTIGASIEAIASLYPSLSATQQTSLINDLLSSPPALQALASLNTPEGISLLSIIISNPNAPVSSIVSSSTFPILFSLLPNLSSALTNEILTDIGNTPSLFTTASVTASIAQIASLMQSHPGSTIPWGQHLAPILSTYTGIFALYNAATPNSFTSAPAAINSTQLTWVIDSIAPYITTYGVEEIAALFKDPVTTDLFSYLAQSVIAAAPMAQLTQFINLYTLSSMASYLPTIQPALIKAIYTLGAQNPTWAAQSLQTIGSNFTLSDFSTLLPTLDTSYANTLIQAMAPRITLSDLPFLTTLSDTNLSTLISAMSKQFTTTAVINSLAQLTTLANTLTIPSLTATALGNALATAFTSPSLIQILTSSQDALINLLPAAEQATVKAAMDAIWDQTIIASKITSGITITQLIPHLNVSTFIWVIQTYPDMASNLINQMAVPPTILTLSNIVNVLPQLSESNFTTLINAMNTNEAFTDATIIASLTPLANSFSFPPTMQNATLAQILASHFDTTIIAQLDTTPQTALLLSAVLPNLSPTLIPALAAKLSLSQLITILQNTTGSNTTALINDTAPSLNVGNLIQILPQIGATNATSLIQAMAPRLTLNDVVNDNSRNNFSDANFQTLMQYMTFTPDAVASDLSNIAFIMQTTELTPNQAKYLGQALAPAFSSSVVLDALANLTANPIPLLTNVITAPFPAWIDQVSLSSLLSVASTNPALLTYILGQPALFTPSNVASSMATLVNLTSSLANFPDTLQALAAAFTSPSVIQALNATSNPTPLLTQVMSKMTSAQLSTMVSFSTLPTLLTLPITPSLLTAIGNNPALFTAASVSSQIVQIADLMESNPSATAAWGQDLAPVLSTYVGVSALYNAATPNSFTSAPALISSTALTAVITAIAPYIGSYGVEEISAFFGDTALTPLFTQIVVSIPTASTAQLTQFVDIYTITPPLSSYLSQIQGPLLSIINATPNAAWITTMAPILATTSPLPYLSPPNLATLVQTGDLSMQQIASALSPSSINAVAKVLTSNQVMGILPLISPANANSLLANAHVASFFTPAYVTANLSTITSLLTPITNLMSVIAPSLTFAQALTLLPQINDANASILIRNMPINPLNIAENLSTILPLIGSLDASTQTLFVQAVAPYLSINDIVNENTSAMTDDNFALWIKGISTNSTFAPQVTADLSTIVTLITSADSANGPWYLDDNQANALSITMATLFSNASFLAALAPLPNVSSFLNRASYYLSATQIEAAIAYPLPSAQLQNIFAYANPTALTGVATYLQNLPLSSSADIANTQMILTAYIGASSSIPANIQTILSTLLSKIASSPNATSAQQSWATQQSMLMIPPATLSSLLSELPNIPGNDAASWLARSQSFFTNLSTTQTTEAATIGTALQNLNPGSSQAQALAQTLASTLQPQLLSSALQAIPTYNNIINPNAQLLINAMGPHLNQTTLFWVLDTMPSTLYRAAVIASAAPYLTPSIILGSIPTFNPFNVTHLLTDVASTFEPTSAHYNTAVQLLNSASAATQTAFMQVLARYLSPAAVSNAESSFPSLAATIRASSPSADYVAPVGATDPFEGHPYLKAVKRSTPFYNLVN